MSLRTGMTVRQMWVIERVALGWTNAEIADDLFVTVGAVKWHLTNIYKRLGISNRTTLMLVYAKWRKDGLA